MDNVASVANQFVFMTGKHEYTQLGERGRVRSRAGPPLFCYYHTRMLRDGRPDVGRANIVVAYDSLKKSDTDPNAPNLPAADNTSAGLKALQSANRYYRESIWPEPFDATTHRLHLGDARDLSWLADGSVHLIVTSPPYWTLKKYEDREGQLGDIAGYEAFLEELDKVWRHCTRVLVEGGRICCVVGDVCLPRKRDGRHRIMPLHADIQVRARSLGLDCLTPILWHKISNAIWKLKEMERAFTVSLISQARL
jgi:hypothetical protein